MITEGTITANGLEFGYLEAGEGPLALCLHGFPDSAWSWRHLLPELADAGYRAVAPFMRGYAPTAVPADDRLQSGALVADGVSLHDALDGDDRAVIIGHDWGAMAAYGIATLEAERWSRVVTLAVPPSPALMSGMLTYDQAQRSWYIWFFQLPLADLLVPADDLAFIDRLWADWSPGYDASDDLPRVKDALRDPANLTAAIGYYRAMFDPTTHDPALAAEQEATSAVPPQPLLYLHGRTDGCMGANLAEAVGAFLTVEGSRSEIVEGAGHFLHLEQPTEVNGRILEFLTT